MKNYDAIIVRKHGVRIKAGTARENRDGSVEIHLDVLPVEGVLKLEVRDATPPKTWHVGDDVCPYCGAIGCKLRAAETPHGTALHEKQKGGR